MYNNNKPCGCGGEGNEPKGVFNHTSAENSCQEDYGFDWGDPIPQPEQRQPGCRWPCGSCCPCPTPHPTECEKELAKCQEQLRICRRRLCACQQELCACVRNECTGSCAHKAEEPCLSLPNEQDAYPMCEE